MIWPVPLYGLLPQQFGYIDALLAIMAKWAQDGHGQPQFVKLCVVFCGLWSLLKAIDGITKIKESFF